ncbi:hypothetical protein C5C00_03910 [Rathayibacter rathayi]|uniref:hypothetical protein n=1 Tax=Rathayibacter rathayi TaxID=33887 RepID=UPI000CE741A0|nr:hypothetical protein [Rathayibacter rathayi]PPG98307.1 hypothetical protein C5C00_03910 [Rathayibacter rathayi]
MQTLKREMEEDEVLRLVDFILANSPRNVGDIKAIFFAAGSAWKVGTRAGEVGLERRVQEGVADAADLVIASSASAGALLAEAWHQVFGRDPNPEEAYSKAIKAVEEAGAHIVLPDNPKATLGTMLNTMAPQGWGVPLEEAAAHPSNDVAVKMARALWSGQKSRHGGNDYRKPTMEEAEAAVLLAVPLVQWFTSGVLARR